MISFFSPVCFFVLVGLYASMHYICLCVCLYVCLSGFCLSVCLVDLFFPSMSVLSPCLPVCLAYLSVCLFYLSSTSMSVLSPCLSCLSVCPTHAELERIRPSQNHVANRPRKSPEKEAQAIPAALRRNKADLFPYISRISLSHYRIITLSNPSSTPARKAFTQPRCPGYVETYAITEACAVCFGQNVVGEYITGFYVLPFRLTYMKLISSKMTGI